MKSNCSTIKEIPNSQGNEKVTLIVVIITLVTMFAEIFAGILSGSMALLSDGIHMGTHALALFITLAAYIFARKHINNPKYSFGTGKVGVLGGYTNAILLLLASVTMAYESIERILDPVEIHFNQAIIVAIIGLIVNIVSAFILGHGGGDSHDHSGHNHSHDNDHHHDHYHEAPHEDHNLKAAYLHVITDAMTSVLAIIALFSAKYMGLAWADPAVGILGAIVVAKWAIGLLKQTSNVLLDKSDFSEEITKIRSHIESESTKVEDIHLWQISDNERSLILCINTSDDHTSEYYHELICKIGRYEHVTIEVNQSGE
jgi:cation diffusion facilitator family transporter